MKSLTLSIKQVHFDEIKAGTKIHEDREIRPKSAHRYCMTDASGEVQVDAKGQIKTVPYEAIIFLTGQHKGTRPKMTVEVKSSEVIILTDDEDNDITYEHEGEEYVACFIRYHLGEVIN